MAENGDKAIFLDRDGVIVEDVGYSNRIEDFKLVEGAAEAIRRAGGAGYKTLVATNQGGIAIGCFSEEDMALFHRHMVETLAAMGAHIDDIAFCPHHPKAEREEDRECGCRKPKPGLILDLAGRHGVDVSASAMIGDRATDVEAGEAAGAAGFLFEGGSLDELMKDVLGHLEGGGRRRDGAP